MKFFTIVAALLLCNSASAATFVYQQNPNQQHGGRYGKDLLPFQLTIITHKGIPANTTETLAVKSVTLNAGGKFQWTQKYNKKLNGNAQFTTDANDNIIAWVVGGGHRRSRVASLNDASYGVQDLLTFPCGTEGSTNNPGTWTHTE
jgi:hypothetical protein